MYCKYCSSRIDTTQNIHHCNKKGLLYIDEDNSFLISAVIGAATGSAIAGGLLGGDILGGLAGDLLDGDLFD